MLQFLFLRFKHMHEKICEGLVGTTLIQLIGCSSKYILSNEQVWLEQRVAGQHCAAACCGSHTGH